MTTSFFVKPVAGLSEKDVVVADTAIANAALRNRWGRYFIETPADIGRLGGFDAGKLKGIKRGRAIVEEQEVRASPPGMASVDSFILAVENPKAIEYGGHARHHSRLAEGIED